MLRKRLAAVALGGFCAALTTACDSGQRPREPQSSGNAAGVPAAPAAKAEPVPQRVAAIGDVATLAPELRRAFDHAGFEPTPEPGPDDWLARHPEKPQSFGDYMWAKRNVPTSRRRVIYLLPIGTFPATAPSIAQLGDLVHAFFRLEVKMLPPVSVGDVTAQRRINVLTSKRQLLAPGVLGWLRQRLPEDGFGLIAVTMEDLYPQPSWNFVFGMASLKDRVAVQSFARQDPAFLGEPRPAGWQKLARRRATWTLLHEVSHMFGLTHCTFWRCVVAGSNHQAEADRSPLHACPVCLRKLHAAIKFDPAARETALAAAFDTLGLHDDAAWSAERAMWIRAGVRAAR